ncbi:DNA recombination/repair protein RecA [Candidatus Parcubacteria bacterium]|nr:DNA recombination/repair protein RecA [Candidatus Parcubacteria bacterium]
MASTSDDSSDRKKDKLGDTLVKRDLEAVRSSVSGMAARQGSLSCGNFWLDWVSGSFDGFFPRGTLIEMMALSGTGKTTTVLETIAYNQHLAREAGTTFKVLYVDFEKNLTLQQGLACGIGVDIADPGFFYCQPRTLESGTQFIIECLRPHTLSRWLKLSSPLDMVVIDTLSAGRPKIEVDNKVGGTNVPGHRGKRWSEAFRNMQADLDPSGPAIVVINHLQEVINMQAWPPPPPGPKRYDSPGSNALKLYAAQRYQLTRNLSNDIRANVYNEFTYETNEQLYAIAVDIECVKSKLGSPYRKSSYIIRPGVGIDQLITMSLAAERKSGALNVAKGHYSIPGDISLKTVVGQIKWFEHLFNSPEATTRLASNLNPLWESQIEYYWKRRARAAELSARGEVEKAPITLDESALEQKVSADSEEGDTASDL